MIHWTIKVCVNNRCVQIFIPPLFSTAVCKAGEVTPSKCNGTLQRFCNDLLYEWIGVIRIAKMFVVPPAYAVRGKAMFSVCLSVHREGEREGTPARTRVPSPALPLPYPQPGPGQGTSLPHPTPSQDKVRVPPHPGRKCHRQDTLRTVAFCVFTQEDFLV